MPARTRSRGRPDEVRREMLRLQIEAERADLVAEAVALKSDELARRGIHLSDLAEGEVPDAGDEAAPGGPVAGQPRRGARRARRGVLARGADARRHGARLPGLTPGGAEPLQRADAVGRGPVSSGDARTTPAPGSLVPARAGGPHRRPPPAGRDGQAGRRSRRLVAGRAVGDRRHGRGELPRGGAGLRPAAGAPLLRLGPSFAGSLSGLIREEEGRLAIRLVPLAPPEDDTRPWRCPLAIRAAFRWEPALASTMRPNQLAEQVLAGFRRAVEALHRP